MEGFSKSYLKIKKNFIYNFSSKGINQNYFDDFDCKKSLSTSSRWYLIALTFSVMSSQYKDYLLSGKFEINTERLYRFAKLKSINCYGLESLRILKREIRDYEKGIINKINLKTNRLESAEQLKMI